MDVWGVGATAAADELARSWRSGAMCRDILDAVLILNAIDEYDTILLWNVQGAFFTRNCQVEGWSGW